MSNKTSFVVGILARPFKEDGFSESRLQRKLRRQHRHPDEGMMHRMNVLLLSLVFLFGRVSSLRYELDAGLPRGLAQQPGLLEVFQVNRPPLTPQELSGATSCTIALMNHNFGNSAGAPFQGKLRYEVRLNQRLLFTRLRGRMGRSGIES
jgi:hypothetical protein